MLDTAVCVGLGRAQDHCCYLPRGGQQGWVLPYHALSVWIHLRCALQVCMFSPESLRTVVTDLQFVRKVMFPRSSELKPGSECTHIHRVCQQAVGWLVERDYADQRAVRL